MGEVIEGEFQRRRIVPWRRGEGLASLLERWRGDKTVWPHLALDHTAPSNEATFAEVPAALAPPVREALARRGIERLYSHQARAFELSAAGKDVVVATPTASGKSLCFNLPVLDSLAREPTACALYLFPTKALSRDQEESLRAMMADASLSHGAITFDGDTPQDARRAARERAGIVLTNPDMLHSGVLPHHTNWARLFANLKWVVIDELHTYRGVFGSHLANVLRRLERVAAFHGSKPRFVFASATIGNPREHAARMLGREVELVGESGAPRGERHVLIYNPPVVNPELGVRQSYVKAAARLSADLVRAGVTTLVFGQSRNTVEVMLKYLRDHLSEERIPLDTLLAYRGGYLPQTRRNIEARLRAGEIRCVVATNALELGIDIGALDAVVCAGYPGNLAALWQRFGRAGRRQERSLSMLVCSSAPLDQYVAQDAEFILRAPVEQARIDPDNVEVLVQHLKCAAFELPFVSGEAFREVPAAQTGEALDFLSGHRVLHRDEQTWHWASDAYPAANVSLRSIGWDNVVIIERPMEKTLAELDWRSAHVMLHEQAIYQHDAEQFQVEKLDLPNRKAFVRRVEPDYFTTALTQTRVEVMSEEKSAAPFASGEVSVVEKVVGFKKVKFHTHENVGYGEVALPELQMHTTGMWLTVHEDIVTSMQAPRVEVVDAVRALGHAMHSVACVGLMIDPRDLGRTLGSRTGQPLMEPTLYLYDEIPGGVGLAPRLFEERLELLARARTLIEGCPCDDGCPACIGLDVGLGAPRRHGRKRLALAVLGKLGA
ncbi:MAG: DEAD/DEAH box helicase [Archangiaceae bacterium]|nr:DEAD/DEAH box helicase [Archangiaceae bacterium]